MTEVHIPENHGWAQHAWEFTLDAGCRYPLYGPEQTRHCLADTWVVVSGASTSHIYFQQLASTLVPGSLNPEKWEDGFFMDGQGVQLIDIVYRDGKAIYKKKLIDHEHWPTWPHWGEGRHSIKRDNTVLPKAFKAVDKAPVFRKGDIRITNMLAQYWDNVDLHLEAINSSVGWSKAKVTVVTDVSLWYVNQFNCHVGGLCTRPEYGAGHYDLNGLIGRFHWDMRNTLDRLETFCGPGGRAAQLGCAVASIEHCDHREIHWKLYHTWEYERNKRNSTSLRFIDLWKLNIAIPEHCPHGHMTPMTAHWTLQVLLGGICTTPPAEGALAVMEGHTCRSWQVNQRCWNYWAKGFTFIWECAAVQHCTLVPLATPRNLLPAAAAARTEEIWS